MSSRKQLRPWRYVLAGCLGLWLFFSIGALAIVAVLADEAPPDALLMRQMWMSVGVAGWLVATLRLSRWGTILAMIGFTQYGILVWRIATT